MRVRIIQAAPPAMSGLFSIPGQVWGVSLILMSDLVASEQRSEQNGQEGLESVNFH